jgi:hypothetical protein
MECVDHRWCKQSQDFGVVQCVGEVDGAECQEQYMLGNNKGRRFSRVILDSDDNMMTMEEEEGAVWHTTMLGFAFLLVGEMVLHLKCYHQRYGFYQIHHQPQSCELRKMS